MVGKHKTSMLQDVEGEIPGALILREVPEYPHDTRVRESRRAPATTPDW